MLRSRDKLAIVLTPDYLSVARVSRGSIKQAERIELDPNKWDESWSGGLHAFDQALRQVLSRIGRVGKSWDAEVFYSSTDCICRVDISELDQAASIEAMVKGLKQSVGRKNPASAKSIYSDEKASVVIGAADSDTNLQKLYAWLNRNKISAKRILPLSASVVRQAARQSLLGPEDTVVLYLSNRSSVIGYSEKGSPKLLRLVDLGYNSIADLYHKLSIENMDSEDHGQSVLTGEPQTVAEPGDMQLFRHAIPLDKDKSGQQFDVLMPSMSPILQRICIEIKQTLRFTGSIDSAPSKLLICGPGAAIPNIAVALGQSLDLNVEADSQAKEFQPSEFFGYGSDDWSAACDLDLDMRLLPMVAVEIETRKKLERTLRVGGAVAAAFIVGQFLHATNESYAIRDAIAEQSSTIKDIQDDQDRREEIRAMASTIETAAGLFEDTMGSNADWVSVLASMPEVDQDTMRIFEVQARMNSNSPVLNLTGSVVAHDQSVNPNTILSEYVRSMNAIDSVRSVEIGSTTRSVIDESTWGLNFILSVEIMPAEGEFSMLTSLYSSSGGLE